MSRRNIVLLSPLAITLILVVSTFLVVNPTVKKFLYLSIPVAAIIVVTVYIFLSWLDHEKLRDDLEKACEKIDRLGQENAVFRSMIVGTIRHLDSEMGEIRKKVFSDMAASLPDLDDAAFAEGLRDLLTESRDRPRDPRR